MFLVATLFVLALVLFGLAILLDRVSAVLAREACGARLVDWQGMSARHRRLRIERLTNSQRDWLDSAGVVIHTLCILGVLVFLVGVWAWMHSL